ncbi:MAG: HD domain-containing protein [Treponema sp.]
MNLQRETAIGLLNHYVTTEHIMAHSFAVEAVMRVLAKQLAPAEEELWGITGLLHDLDIDVSNWQEHPERHGPVTVELLKQHNFGCEEMYSAIIAHNPDTGTVPQTLFEKALYAADPITGFITAIALIYPDKKITSVKVKSITKKMKETRFAAGADRGAMMSIENIGIPFPEFAELSLAAMCSIADSLGL